MTGKFNISNIDQRAKDVAEALALEALAYLEAHYGLPVHARVPVRNFLRNKSFLIANAMRTADSDATPPEVGRYTPGDAIQVYRQRQKPHRLTERETVAVPAVYLGTTTKGKPVIRQAGKVAREVLNSFSEIAS